MSYNMDVMVDYFADALAPYSMYIWVAVAVVLCGYSLYKARKMVYEI
jgi:hypothetical protein